MSLKGAKSPARGRKHRSSGTKTRARVSSGPNSLIELKKQLETRACELAEARGHLSEALEQQAATDEVAREGITDTNPGELTQRQIDRLRASATRGRQSKAKRPAFTLDLEKDAVNRILDAVDKYKNHVLDLLRTEEARFEELRHELSCARWTFFDRQLEQGEPSGARKRKALEGLTKAARRFFKAIDTFERDGRLGWSVLEIGADRHRLEVEQAQEVLSLERRTLYEKKRVNDQLIFAYQDHGFATIFDNAKLTADAVALPAAERWAKENGTNVDEMLAPAPEGPKQERAMHWLIGVKLREIYLAFIASNYAWGNVFRDGRREADSPAMRFALQTIEEFGIVSERGRPYTADAIKNYWPRRRTRSDRV